MNLVSARNVHEALPIGLAHLREEGHCRPSRNGDVLQVDNPVTTLYERPKERVLFWAQRDANPFFHLLESLWMLAGRNDVDYVASLVGSMRNFSDDGLTFNGAYGYRWREHFDIDQLDWAVHELRDNPTSRRVVIGMWDAGHDIDKGIQGSKDLPCNLALHLQVNRHNQLDMTVFNRSNDVIWGAYGANAVHFSVLQEFIASMVGIPVGRYWQVSDNYHAYEDVYSKMTELADFELGHSSHNPYALGEVSPYPLVSTDYGTWMMDLDLFMSEGAVVGLRDPFFRRVAVPMLMAYKAFKKFSGEEKFLAPLEILQNCGATDWRRAGEEWLMRRANKWQRAQDAGVDHDD